MLLYMRAVYKTIEYELESMQEAEYINWFPMVATRATCNT